MPFTPFHLGPGGIIHAMAPRRVSFLAFCAANVLIDVEPLYYILSGQYPLHRFFHTYVGATVITAATMVLFRVALKASASIRLPNLFGWQELRMGQIALGAAAGAYSHIVLDSIMHSDIRPFSPFSQGNGLLPKHFIGNPPRFLPADRRGCFGVGDGAKMRVKYFNPQSDSYECLKG